jgi:hypothetical protein
MDVIQMNNIVKKAAGMIPSAFFYLVFTEKEATIMQ